MFLDFPSRGDWGNFEKLIKSSIGEGQYRIKSYYGLNHALNEVLRGLVKLFVHKDSLALFKDQGPWFFQFGELFSSEGKKINFLNTQTFISDLNALTSQNIFCLCSADDPLTGEINDLNNIEDTLKTKKIFTVKVFHHLHQFREIKIPDPYSIYILSFKNDFTVVLLGERTQKLESFMKGDIYWNEKNIENLKVITQKKTENKKIVSEFESHFTKILKTENRVWDRALIRIPGINADFLAHSLKHPNETVESLNLCRFNGFQITDYLILKGFTQEEINEILILDISILSEKLKKQITESALKFKSIFS